MPFLKFWNVTTNKTIQKLFDVWLHFHIWSDVHIKKNKNKKKLFEDLTQTKSKQIKLLYFFTESDLHVWACLSQQEDELVLLSTSLYYQLRFTTVCLAFLARYWE